MAKDVVAEAVVEVVEVVDVGDAVADAVAVVGVVVDGVAVNVGVVVVERIEVAEVVVVAAVAVVVVARDVVDEDDGVVVAAVVVVVEVGGVDVAGCTDGAGGVVVEEGEYADVAAEDEVAEVGVASAVMREKAEDS